MGWKFRGGGFYNGIPARDLTDAEVSLLPTALQHIVREGGRYEQSDDIEPQPRRIETRFKNILLVCPTYRLEPETVDRIHGQKWNRGALDFFFTRDNPHSGETLYRNIELNMNKARQVFLKGKYDAMFIVESDMLPPYDALERLAMVEADIAGGLYVMRQWEKATNAMVYDPSRGKNLSAIPLHELRGVDLVRTNGVSNGCALIRRDVLEEVVFRAELPLPPDSAFMQDCNDAGFVTVCDTSVVCGHKCEDGRVLYPELN